VDVAILGFASRLKGVGRAEPPPPVLGILDGTPGSATVQKRYLKQVELLEVAAALRVHYS
jgi:hypothetical protein